MIFRETTLGGAFVVELEPQNDERGFFARSWCQKEFADHGLNPRLVQASVSHTRHRGMLRGLHYQTAPYEEAKLVQCFRGAIFDVIVDVRPASPTYLQWIGVTLSSENRHMLYVPEGFAHGFQTLEDDTDVLYQMSEFFTPSAATGARWDDPAFGVRWPDVERRLLSPRDQSWPPFSPVKTPRSRAVPSETRG